jgi:serine/threonine-protein kinase
MPAESETQVLPRERSAQARPPSAPVVDRTDQLVGRYELLHRLGHGGMATVYLGRARGKAGFEKKVAVKVIHPHLANEPDLVGMFLDEARIAADLHHPHVVEILDLGDDDGVHFMVMEFVEGETLSALLRATAPAPLAPAIALQIVADACEGLGAAHELVDAQGRNRGLVHRDVSPQNLMIGLDGRVKVTDFGIMKAAGKTTHTRPGELRGKLAYMSPEQARGEVVDHRTDLFALGVILWELVTGERLFAGDTDAATLEKVMRCDVPAFDPAPGGLAAPASVLRGLSQFFTRALSVPPDGRFQSAGDMLAELRRIQAGCPDGAEAREQLARLMREKFAQRAEYLRAALREGTPLRSNTRKRSSMISVAAAARTATDKAMTPSDLPIVGPPPLASPRSRPWAMWLVLPAIGAGLAAALMTMRQGAEEAPPAPGPSSAAAPVAMPEQPTPAVVRWHFTTTPPGATVIVAGQPQPKTTPTWVTVPRSEDPVQVVLRRDGYLPTTDMLAPLADQNFPYQLVPLRENGAQEALGSTPATKKKRPRPGTPQPPAEDTAAAESDRPHFRPSPFPDKGSNQH